MSSAQPIADVDALLRRAKLAKAQAKDLRDEGEFTEAVAVLNRVLEQLSAAAPDPKGDAPATPDEQRLAMEMADCLGMLGGNLRRAGALADAQDAFMRGLQFEGSARLQLSSSYNLVNAITLPLESGAAGTGELADALRDAIAAIERQVAGERRRDRWAWADLAECRLLLGDLDGARMNYEQASRLGDSETVDSIVAVLRRLQAALQGRDPQAAERIAAALSWLSGAAGAV